MKQKIESLHQGQSAKYQIKVQGRLNEGWTDWFDNMVINFEQNTEGPTITTLTGIVQDQAALHGLLNRIRDLSILLLSVQLINPPVNKGVYNMNANQKIIQTVLKAVAVGMSVASIVLGYLGTVDAGTQVSLLSLGLFALSVAALQKKE